MRGVGKRGSGVLILMVYSRGVIGKLALIGVCRQGSISDRIKKGRRGAGCELMLVTN